MIRGLVIVAGLLSAASARGEEVDVGGRAIHLECSGRGSPTIVLTSGLGEGGKSWDGVRPELAKLSRVCAWDRAGLGSSDASAEPQDVSHTTSDLERALKAARVDGPYILVGHSIGSFETLMFTYRHPRQVAGIVLVDPTSPFQRRTFAAAVPAYGAFLATGFARSKIELRACAKELRAGVSRPESCGEDDTADPMAKRIAATEAVASMMENIDASSAQLVAAEQRIAVPLIVLTAGRRPPLPGDLASETPKVQAEWSRMHDVLAARSDHGVNRQVPDAMHYIHHDRPDAVVAAVRETLSAARTQGRR